MSFKYLSMVAGAITEKLAVKADIDLGNVDNTSDATKQAAFLAAIRDSVVSAGDTLAKIYALLFFKQNRIQLSGIVYVRTPVAVTISVTAAAVLTKNYYAPIQLVKSVSFDAMAIRSGTSFSGTATIRLGLYSHDDATGLPKNLLADCGTVSVTVADTTYTKTTTPVTLQPGIYWLACNVISKTGTLVVYGTGTSSVGFNSLLGAISTDISAGVSGVLGLIESYDATAGFGATAGSTSGTTQLPVVWARVQ